MSNLPEIDHQKVANKLAVKLAEANLQITQIEALAESLRDQRDEALRELASAVSERDKAREDLEAFKEELNNED